MWWNRIMACLNQWRIISQGEAQREDSSKQGKRPKAEEAAKTLGWCCSDQIPAAFSQWRPELHQQLEFLQQPGGQGSSLGAEEVNPDKELPVLLVCLI